MRLIITALATTLCVGLASAQEAGRFTMEKTPDGYVRMDNGTGQMSLCKENGAQLVCQLAADDRDAFQDEVARLQEKLDAVEKRVAALETGIGAPSSSMPTEEDFDKTMSYMQRFFRGFIDIVKELDRDLRGPDQPPGPLPDRT